MRARVRRFGWALLVGACLASLSASAQDLGKVTNDGVEMPIKGVVAIFNAERHTLEFYLLPFKPSAEETALLQKNDRMWFLKKASPDSAKWPNHAPFARATLGWNRPPYPVGDLANGWFNLYGFSIKGEFTEPSIGFPSGQLVGTLVRTVKPGADIAFKSSGEKGSGERKMVWDFDVRTKVLTALE